MSALTNTHRKARSEKHGAKLCESLKPGPWRFVVSLQIEKDGHPADIGGELRRPDWRNEKPIEDTR